MVINGFIVFLLFVIWCWNLPDDCLARKLIRPWKGFILYTGLWHGWNMFAPEPLFVNRRLTAIVYLKNNAVIEWRSEDVGRMSWWRAFLFVRERKMIDNLLSNQMAYLKPALADFLARQYRSQGFEVTRIELVQFRRVVPPPEKWRDVGDFERKVIWTYTIEQSAALDSRPTMVQESTDDVARRQDRAIETRVDCPA